MHEGQKKAKRARDILTACGIDIGTDFHGLSASQIDALVACLEQHRVNKYGPVSKYRRLPSDNNSAVRSFYDLLQRRATHQLRSNRGISRTAADLH
jgi:hypothetical protein